MVQERNTNEFNYSLAINERKISAMNVDIVCVQEKIAQIEKKAASDDAKRVKVITEIESAKKMADVIKNAFERALKDANDFVALPDEELVTEMKHLDEMEENVIEDANLQRNVLIKSKYDC